MEDLSFFFLHLIGPTFFWQWRAIIEILFLSAIFYHMARWLKKDTTKNLLPYFFGYCILTIGSYTLDLNTINHLLLIFSPAVFCLFILAHQEVLQRNLVALKNITPAQKQEINWIETLFRSLLHAVSLQKKVIVLIERTDVVVSFLDTPFVLNAPISYDLLSLLMQSPSYTTNAFIWVNQHGILRAMNCNWKQSAAPKSMLATNAQDEWIENALLYTQKTDACMFTIDPNTNRCTIVHKGHQQKNVQTTHAIQMITMLTKQKKEVVYERNKTDQSQRTT